MTYLLAYLVVAVIMVELDGLSCYVSKKYFHFTSSVIIALIWPISISVVIYMVWKECKQYKPFTKPLTKSPVSNKKS